MHAILARCEGPVWRARLCRNVAACCPSLARPLAQRLPPAAVPLQEDEEGCHDGGSAMRSSSHGHPHEEDMELSMFSAEGAYVLLHGQWRVRSCVRACVHACTSQQAAHAGLDGRARLGQRLLLPGQQLPGVAACCQQARTRNLRRKSRLHGHWPEPPPSRHFRVPMQSQRNPCLGAVWSGRVGVQGTCKHTVASPAVLGGALKAVHTLAPCAGGMPANASTHVPACTPDPVFGVQCGSFGAR